MKTNNINKKLNVVLIGVTGRPQSMNAALGILKGSRHNLSCVLFQKRFSKRATSLKFYRDLITKFSFRFITSKIAELVKLKLNSISAEETFQEIVERNNTEYVEVDDVNSQYAVSIIKRKNPDVIILSGAPIVKGKIIDCAKKYTINVHRSLLPKYAGLDAIFWALYHDEDKVGATVHTVNEKIDAGKIILQAEREVLPGDTIDSLTAWYEDKVSELFVESLDLICDPDFSPAEQDFSQRSYFSWPTKSQRRELEKKLKEQQKEVNSYQS